MKNKIILLFFFISISFGNILNDFKNRDYNKICNFKNILANKDDKILSLVGISCVRADRLYLLPYIFKKLKYTKLGRLNAIYLSTIYMQKKLLYSYFFDNLKLDNFDLPDTDYIISHVFYKIKNKDYTYRNNIYTIHYGKKVFKVYKNKDKLIIDEYNNSKMIKRHWFR